MIERIDRFLNKIAKRILIIADFWGISNYTVIYAWALLSSMAIVMPIKKQEDLSIASMFIHGAIASVLLILVEFKEVRTILISLEKNNDILPDCPELISALQRICNISFYIIVSLLVEIIFRGKQYHYELNYSVTVCLFKIMFPFQFWHYFILNWNTKCRKRVKDRILDAISLAPKKVSQPSFAPI